jgi:hypothetical protein
MLFSFVTTKNKQTNDIELCNAKTKRTYLDCHYNKTNKITYNKFYAKFLLYSCFGSLMLFSSRVVATFPTTT